MRRITAPALAILTVVGFCALPTQSTMAQTRVEEVCQLPPNTSTEGNTPACGLPLVGRRSLTVVGQGRVIAPADTALMEFSIGGGSPPSSESESSQQASEQTAAATLSPTIKALTALGIPASNITVQTSPTQNAKLLVKLDKPTQAQMQQAVQTVTRSLKSNQQLALQGVSAGYAVNNCQPLERNARQIALQDARSQLTTLAQDVKVGLGELLSVVVMPFVGSRTAISCGSKVAVPASPLSLLSDDGLPPYNPSDKPEVQLSSQVSVTHAIAATNRR